MLKKLFAINKKETGSYILGHVPGEQVFMLHFCEENRTVYLNENGARTVCDKPEEPDENESGDPCQIGDMINGFYAFTTHEFSEDADGRYGLFGVKDASGAVIADEQFRDVECFRCGLCPVKNAEERWGCIDENGTLIIPFRYSDPPRFNLYGLAVGDDGLIDKTGARLAGITFDCADFFDEDDRYIITNRFTKEQSDAIAQCGTAPGITDDFFDSKTRTYLVKGIPERSIRLCGSPAPEAVLAAVELLHAFEDIRLYDAYVFARRGDETVVFKCV
ncbi:MAG: WG repeat-containing protein [Clostridia bacterium]|nr:WG repeat-containing protein [Clostridia bacterium]